MELSIKPKYVAERLVVHSGGKSDSENESQTASELEDQLDNQLVAQFINGDTTAFDQIVERYKEKIYSFIYFQINQKQADAEDLTQDVFLEFYKQANNYRGESKFSTYLFSISRNLVLNYFRHHRRRYTDKTDSICIDDEQNNEINQGLVDQSSPLDSVINDDLQQQVHNAIDKLKPEERQLLLLTDREGFSYEQIGNILSIKVGTVRSRLNSARSRLLQFLKVNKNDM